MLLTAARMLESRRKLCALQGLLLECLWAPPPLDDNIRQHSMTVGSGLERGKDNCEVSHWLKLSACAQHLFLRSTGRGAGPVPPQEPQSKSRVVMCDATWISSWQQMKWPPGKANYNQIIVPYHNPNDKAIWNWQTDFLENENQQNESETLRLILVCNRYACVCLA